jgi:hypothetical protein
MCHFGLAGTPVEIELLLAVFGDRTHYGAQVYRDGNPFSGPITTGEAGFYEDEDGRFYTYAYDGPGDDNPQKTLADMVVALQVATGGSAVHVISSLGLG